MVTLGGIKHLGPKGIGHLRVKVHKLWIEQHLRLLLLLLLLLLLQQLLQLLQHILGSAQLIVVQPCHRDQLHLARSKLGTLWVSSSISLRQHSKQCDRPTIGSLSQLPLWTHIGYACLACEKRPTLLESSDWNQLLQGSLTSLVSNWLDKK
ncbi:hypothetical protein EYF80_027490 [Liparis tanakae]|uniref:Uncharacterized protein n=1 Tax=Liparis tanakae TaxID=230148 RepID=A0A4Z2H953_9TELE|nr:hypothetical protein EYF80_027490 [Liparis tanakae]